MTTDLDELYSGYVRLFIGHLGKQDAPHRNVMAAAMMTAACAHESHVQGVFSCAEKLRDLADEIERGEGPARGPMQ
ncbi:hypothetical protein [Roseinatronobacter bogoriensis]|nr:MULTISPECIES: hypothetical protein [Rhodobaca]